jgi:hypothetical protein
VTVTPGSTELEPGQQQSFDAEGRDGDGDAAPVQVSWSATGGTVDAGGLFTAGDQEGSFRVVATDTSGLADTASVDVLAVPSSPSTGECANPDPAWIWCDDFEEDRLSSYFEYNDYGGDFVRADGVGVDGSWAMRAHFDADQVSGGWLHLAVGKTPDAYIDPVDEGTAIYRDLYWRVYLRNQSGWIDQCGDKLSRVTSLVSPDWAQAMIAPVWSGCDPSNQEYLVVEPVSGTDASGDVQTTGYNDDPNLRYLGPDRGETPIFDEAHVGEWYCVEAHVRLNDPGASNGVFEMWIDGSLDARATDLNWVGDYQEYGINAVFLENYNGGSPQAQDRFMDRFVVSTERIGC